MDFLDPAVSPQTDPRGEAAYLLVRVRAIHDPERYQKYRSTTAAILDKHGAHYIVRGFDEVTLEGESADRITIIEFPSQEGLHEFWNSRDYIRARELRRGAADVTVGILQGFRSPNA